MPKSESLQEKVDRLQAWVSDLQAGMYINCVYCGHRYGPDSEVPASMADVLKEHIEQCPEHPLSAAMAHIRELEAAQRPFVLWAKAFMELFPDKADDWTYAGLTVGPDGTGQALTMGDLRRIAALKGGNTMKHVETAGDSKEDEG